jgi:nucleotide-binding universal stress UspA family protein
MTAVRNKAIGEQTAAAHPARRAVEAKPRTQKILAVVDGSERTGRVLEYLIGLTESGVPIEVVVLNVQPEPEDWRLRGYISFKQDEIHDRLVNDLGKPIVSSVGRTLDQGGIAHKDRIELGELAETILRCANEEHCNLIIVSEPRPGAIRRWLTRTAGLSFGSVASNVVQLAEMPVIVVK